MGARVTAQMRPLVIALTRGWVRAYTCRMSRHLADARRAEIESDLWEMEHDPELAPGLAGASMALARLVDGMAHDVAWRFDNAAREEQFIVRRALALVAAMLLALSLWPVPSWFLGGHRSVAACAASAPKPKTLGALQYEVIRCTGAFFSSPR